MKLNKILKNSTPGKVACIWHIEQVQIDATKRERTQIHFLLTFSLPSSSSLLKVLIDSILLKNSEGNRDRECIFCRRREADVALFLQVTRMRKIVKICGTKQTKRIEIHQSRITTASHPGQFALSELPEKAWNRVRHPKSPWTTGNEAVITNHDLLNSRK